jgi:hypothetical protein
MFKYMNYLIRILDTKYGIVVNGMTMTDKDVSSVEFKTLFKQLIN